MQTIIFDVDGVIFKAMDAQGCYLWRKDIETDLGVTPEHISEIYNADWDNVTRGKRDIRTHLQDLFDTCPELNLNAEQYLAYWHKNDIHIDPEILRSNGVNKPHCLAYKPSASFCLWINVAIPFLARSNMPCNS